MCEDIKKAWVESIDFTNRLNAKQFKFCNAGAVFFDKFGIIHPLFNESGLSLDGIREFNNALVV